MAYFLIYFFPFAVDVVLSLLLFVGRHALGSTGASEAVVGSIPLYFGIGYFLSGPLMRIMIKRKWARVEMLAAIALMALLSLLLAHTERVHFIQALFFLVPFSASLFFNAFQAFMLGFSIQVARPLHVTVGLYTFAWSMGFALGPFVSGWTRDYLAWSQIYYLAVLLCLGIGLLVIFFLHSEDTGSERQSPSITKEEITHRPSRVHIAGWIGVVIGLIAWLTVATYWPVLAAAREVSDQLKGMVEFAFAATQGLLALLLVFLGPWQRNPLFLPLFGIAGVASLALFAVADSDALFLTAASLTGVFTAGTFLFSIYHCMVDDPLASKRIAVNEMMVGFGYIVAPLIASLLYRQEPTFAPAFTRAALLIALLVALQTVVAMILNRGSRRREAS